MGAEFNWLDYTVLFIYVAAILGIAAIFMREKDLAEFFMGSRKMPWWAVGCSIFATLLSAISITGVPAEFWQNGLRAYGNLFILIAAVPVVVYLFIRVYRHLNVVTAYQYLEKRFSTTVRLIASTFFLLLRGSYMAFVIYGAAVLLRPGLGERISLGWLIVTIGFLSMIFAVVGGIKGVIWTDVVQMFVIYGGLGLIFLVLLARIDGGFSGMWAVAAEHGKDFSYLKEANYWSFDLFEHTTIWAIVIGYFTAEMAQQGADQLTVQRYMTTNSGRSSARSLWTYVILSAVVITLLWLVAMAIFAFYQQNPGIDPITNNPDFEHDSILSHFVVTQLPHGVGGLFVAAFVAAVLTTVDSGLNSLATATMSDFHLRLLKKERSDKYHVVMARLWTVFWGVVATGFALIFLQIGKENITRTAVNMGGLYSGPLLGIFLLGLLVKRSNSIGVAVGAVAGWLVAIWANFGMTKASPTAEIDWWNFAWMWSGGREEVVRISFTWSVVIGCLGTLIIGYAVSLLFARPSREQLDKLTFWDFRKAKLD